MTTPVERTAEKIADEITQALYDVGHEDVVTEEDARGDVSVFRVEIPWDGKTWHAVVTDELPDPDESTEMVVRRAIHDIEEAKGRVRIEHDDLHRDYVAGSYWSRQGLTKRQAEDRLARRTGEILGYENALSFLYRLVDPT